MKLINDSAHLFFVISTRQFINGVINAHTYQQYLESLRRMTKKNTLIYKIVLDILNMDDEITPDSIEDRIDKSEDKDSSLLEIFKKNPDSLLFQGDVMINDPDPWPSKPHLHVFDKRINKNKKVNIFTGKSTEGRDYSDNELITLWNDSQFVKKLTKNLDTICSNS